MSWIALSEYAARMGIGQRTAARWAAEGRVRSRRTPGGHWRIDADCVPLLITIPEAARQLGSSERTVRSWAEAGKLGARRMSGGSGWLVEAAGIDRIMAVENEGGSR